MCKKMEALGVAEGGALRKYYPLNEEGLAELEEWKQKNAKK